MGAVLARTVVEFLAFGLETVFLVANHGGCGWGAVDLCKGGVLDRSICFEGVVFR